MTNDQDHARLKRLAGFYALGALTSSDRALFEEHMETCRSCVDEVMSLLPVSHLLTRAVPYYEPPPELKERVYYSVTGTPPAKDVDDFQVRSGKTSTVTVPSNKSGIGRILANLMVLIFLAAAIGIGWYASQQVNLVQALKENLDAANQRATISELQAAAAQQITREANERTNIFSASDLVTMSLVSQPAAPDARARVHWSAKNGVLLTVSGLPSVPAGLTYHLWFVPAMTPLSGGPLPIDDAGRIAARVDPPNGVTELVPVAITLEPVGARETPSGEVYFLGRPAM